MAAGQEAGAGARPGGTVPEFFDGGMLGRIINAAAESRTEVSVVAGCIGDQIVAPIIETPAMRIGKPVGGVGFKFAGARLVAIDGCVIITDWPGGSLHLRAMEDAIAEKNR